MERPLDAADGHGLFRPRRRDRRHGHGLSRGVEGGRSGALHRDPPLCHRHAALQRGRAALRGRPGQREVTPAMPLRGVIFDLDGTVVENAYDWTRIREEIGTGETSILAYLDSLQGPERAAKWSILERHEARQTQGS